VGTIRKQGVVLAKSATFQIPKQSEVIVTQSKAKLHTSSNSNKSLITDEETKKELAKNAEVLQLRNPSVGTCASKSVDPIANPTIDQSNDVEKLKKVNESEVVVQKPRTRPMGTRVATLVAAFSNGMSV
jgi:hypothetical protein